MSLNAEEQATIIGIGLATLFALGGGIWKTASLRGDVNVRWSRRVAFAVAALDDKTITELEVLRDEIDEVLPTSLAFDDQIDQASVAPFDPQQVLVDPTSLTRRAARATEYHKARVRMDGCVRRLMSLGRVAIAMQLLLVVGAAGATAFYSELIRWHPLEWIALAILSIGAVMAVAVGGAYIVLQDRLASGEDLAGTAGRAEQES